MNYSKRYNELRALLRPVSGDSEVRNFYLKLSLESKRGGVIGPVAIPEPVVDRLYELVAEYSGLYEEVSKVPVKSDGRAWISIGNASTVWAKMGEHITEIDADIDRMEMETLFLGGILAVDESIAESTLLNFSVYMEELMAKAIASGIDNGIVNGKGDYDTVWEPMGIIDNLDVANTIETDLTLSNILSYVALIDPGKKDDIGEVVAAMSRKTYYKRIIQHNANSYPYPNINGMRVKFVAALPEDHVLLGDFKEYVLSERNSLEIRSSYIPNFDQDKNTYKVSLKGDGQPHNSKAFVLLKQQSAE